VDLYTVRLLFQNSFGVSKKQYFNKQIRYAIRGVPFAECHFFLDDHKDNYAIYNFVAGGWVNIFCILFKPLALRHANEHATYVFLGHAETM